MYIKVVIHKNGLPIAVNFQTERLSPVGVQHVLRANGPRATWGLLRQGHRPYKASRSPPQENPQSTPADPSGHFSSMHIMAARTGRWQSYHYALGRKWRAGLIKHRWEDSFKLGSPHQASMALPLKETKTIYNLAFMFLWLVFFGGIPYFQF